ncbi:MAG: TIM barrel protein [Verrucomicrobiota bacterium]
MKRRAILAGGLATAAAGLGRVRAEEVREGAEPFKVLFAPNPRHFGVGKDEGRYLDAMKQAHDLGFRAWEDNGMKKVSRGLQEQIGEFLREHDWTMGVTVVTTGHKAVFAEASAEEQERILGDYRQAVELAKVVGHKWFTLVPGCRNPEVELSKQIAGQGELMQRGCDLFEEAGLVAVVEPLSHPMRGAPVLLETFVEGMEFCQAVNRPESCRLLADYFHEQQMAGDLIRHTDECWDWIEYVQYGDVPGRKQPGTGEINYTNVTKHLVEKGYEGVIGLEHGIAGTLEDLVGSYREIDGAL